MIKKPFTPARFWKTMSAQLLLPAACAATLSGGLAAAAAQEDLPFREAIQAQLVSATPNPDGTVEQVFQGAGTGTYAGRVTVEIHVHVANGSYDPLSNSWVTPLSGTAVLTGVRGDTLTTTFSGAEITAFDQNGNPQPPPFRVQVLQQVVAGTGWFEDASGKIQTQGFDYGAGTVAFVGYGTLVFESD